MNKQDVVTIADVARVAEVSLGTVSRVLNHNPTVRSVTRKAVLAAIEQLGYRPNINARNLRSQRTWTVGMLMGDLTQAVAPQAVRGVETGLRASGYAIVIGDGRADPDIEAEAFTNLLDRRVDALLWFPVMHRSKAEALAAGAGIPVVFFGQTSASSVIPTAVVDEQPAFEAMACELAALGHRRVGFLGAGITVRGRTRRLDRALAGAGIERDARFEATVDKHNEDTYPVVAEMLGREIRPTALVATPHDLVPHAIRAVRDAGLRVPDDISLIGFGDTEWAIAIDPPLSVITVDYETHARDAAGMLLRRIEGDEAAPRSVRHQSRYIHRASVGPAPPSVI